MSQVSLGDGVEMAKESTDTAPIEHQPAQSAGDIGHLEVMSLLSMTRKYVTKEVNNISADCTTQHPPSPPCRERQPDNLLTC